MKGMDGFGWMLVIVAMVVIFVVMELEKALRRSLKASGSDTDDREPGPFDSTVAPPVDMKLPKGASKLNLQELNH